MNYDLLTPRDMVSTNQFFFWFCFFLTLLKRMNAVHFLFLQFCAKKRPPLPFPKTMLGKTQTPCPGAGPSGVSVFPSMVLGRRQRRRVMRGSMEIGEKGCRANAHTCSSSREYEVSSTNVVAGMRVRQQVACVGGGVGVWGVGG